MFEKSLYDLIRGLRNHKGNERAYIQDNIRECRREIRTQDMDLKATALLKLTYLEMFGHDMSWASFNVLEVMSSQKYPQKRVGYLAAVQSFRPDTEVLMLAENQLKKDLASPIPPTISLPLVAIPHVISAPMANSLLSDLLPRLSHSHPIIRKKTIVTLYRLALVYPETLRPAWPKLKERLMDSNEDSTVTAAVVNVVCELGWRRPQDFLSLAPRLFDLLVEGSNNWMAIKIIKLFATLTPLEPRLVKKLLPPLTTIIKTTVAMSLLYECINGIIVSGILTNASGTTEGDEIARLCVSKLRGMLALEGDRNIKYVALLAFERIAELHPYLVSLHQDVILDCIDDPDLSIRLRALDLASNMVNAQNLEMIVERLMRQLRNSPLVPSSENVLNDRGGQEGVEPSADSDDEGPSEIIRPSDNRHNETPQLPDEYRVSVIRNILLMCSKDTYSFINDFDWYLRCLYDLIEHVPTTKGVYGASLDDVTSSSADGPVNAAFNIGAELQNVAVRVRSSRNQAVRIAESLLSGTRTNLNPKSPSSDAQSILGSAAWIAGEFVENLANPRACLDCLISPSVLQLQPQILNVYVYASMKLCAYLLSDRKHMWTVEHRSMASLLLSRMVHFLEQLSIHPDLETQETAVQFLELVRLASEAIDGQGSFGAEEQIIEAPLLLTQALPSLFSGSELNPVAKNAQYKVPVPSELDLADPIDSNLNALLNAAGSVKSVEDDEDFFEYYYKRLAPTQQIAEKPAAERLPAMDDSISYQQSDTLHLDPELAARRRADRESQFRDDPFYISGPARSRAPSPVHDILKSSNGDELDVDSIPVMELNLGDDLGTVGQASKSNTADAHGHDRPQHRAVVMKDENIEDMQNNKSAIAQNKKNHGLMSSIALNGSLLQVDSSGLGSLSLSENNNGGAKGSQLDVERREAEEAEMARAMKEVERLRLEMQRAQERVESKQDTTVVKKKPRKVRATSTEAPDNVIVDDRELKEGEGTKVRKKKKKKTTTQGDGNDQDGVIEEVPATKKKKRRRVANLDEVQDEA